MNFKELAKKATSTSKVMEGRNKVDVNDIIAAYPNGFTVDSIDMANGKDGDFAIVSIKEDNNIFFFGGSVLTQVVRSWVEYCSGDIDAVNAGLAEEPVKLKLSHARSKAGRTYVAVTVID